MANDTKTTSSTLLDAQGQVMHQAADQAQVAGDRIVDSIRRRHLRRRLYPRQNHLNPSVSFTRPWPNPDRRPLPRIKGRQTA